MVAALPRDALRWNRRPTPCSTIMTAPAITTMTTEQEAQHAQYQMERQP